MNRLKKSCWTVYMLRNERNALYTGVTTNLERRLAEHQKKISRCARFTRSCKSVDLVYHCDIGGHGAALTVEAKIKRLAKDRKEMIVAAGLKKTELYDFLSLPEIVRP
jgi:putative endonuclease